MPDMSLPHLAPLGNASIPHSALTPTADLPFTDAQVEEFREQDRWLPVSISYKLWPAMRLVLVTKVLDVRANRGITELARRKETAVTWYKELWRTPRSRRLTDDVCRRRRDLLYSNTQEE
jgi:hypothetical protein